MTILFVIMAIIVFFAIAVYMLGRVVMAKAIEFFNDINNKGGII